MDAGSSLVGGTIAAVQHAAAGALHMLPESIQTQASHLQSRAAEITKPVADSYANDGILAAAKTAGGIGAGAVSTLGTQASTKAASLVGSTKAAAVEPKKHGRRRRGGRGHGNRKFKTRVLPEAKVETIADTLGEKAAELKEVVVEALPGKKRGSTAAPGIIGSIRNTAQGIVNSATSTASGLVAGATSTASGLVAGATSTASGLVAGAQEKIQSTLGGSSSGSKDVKGGKKASLDRKPTLERRDELPSLGTPNTPDSGVSQKQLPATAAPTTLLGKASAIVDSAKSYVADKLDNLSMNADDNGEMEDVNKSHDSILDKASQQLSKMADAISSDTPVEQKEGKKEGKKEKL